MWQLICSHNHDASMCGFNQHSINNIYIAEDVSDLTECS